MFFDKHIEKGIAAKSLSRPRNPTSIRRSVMNPNPFFVRHFGVIFEHRHHLCLRAVTIPPRTNRDQNARRTNRLPIDKQSFGCNFLQPRSVEFALSIAGFTIVIARTNDHIREAAEVSKIFRDDRDLNFKFEITRDVEQIARHDHIIIMLPVSDQPIELLKVVMKIRCEKEFQPDWLAVDL